MYESLNATIDHIRRLYQWEQDIRELAQKLGSARPTREAMIILARESLRLLQADRTFIIEFDGESPLPVDIEFLANSELQSYKGVVPPWESCPYLRKAAARQLVLTEDTHIDEIEPCWLEFFKRAGIRGFLACPVIADNRIHSVLVTHTHNPRIWSEGDIALIRIGTDQIALRVFQDLLDEARS